MCCSKSDFYYFFNLIITPNIDRSLRLKSGTTSPKESNDYSSNQGTENNEVNVESNSILKEPVKKKRKGASTTREVINQDSHELDMKMSILHFASFVLKIQQTKT